MTSSICYHAFGGYWWLAARQINGVSPSSPVMDGYAPVDDSGNDSVPAIDNGRDDNI